MSFVEIQVAFQIIGLLVIAGLLYSVTKNLRRSPLEGEHWGLGVDSYVFYTRKFSITNNRLEIRGWQSVLDETATIQYSIVKRKWGIYPVYLAICKIQGNHPAYQSFQQTFKNLPNGKGYQIEISNLGCMSEGTLFILNESNPTMN